MRADRNALTQAQLAKLRDLCDLGDRCFALALANPDKPDFLRALGRLCDDVVSRGAWTLDLESLEPHRDQIVLFIHDVAVAKRDLVLEATASPV